MISEEEDDKSEKLKNMSISSINSQSNNNIINKKKRKILNKEIQYIIIIKLRGKILNILVKINILFWISDVLIQSP